MNCFSQNQDSGRIYQDSRIDSLIQKHIRINEKKRGVSGYRVQISFSNNKEIETKKRADFIRKYPDVKVYLEYNQPNYIILAGNFRTRIEAQQLLDQVKYDYKTSFIVISEVILDDIESNPNTND